MLTIGLYAASQPLALSISSSTPEAVNRLAPNNARILARRAEMLTPSTSSTQRNRAADLARRALLRDPLQPSAAAALGFYTALRGDAGMARRAFAYSQRVSRRDLNTHLWAIEYAVSRGDLNKALRHYDLALRTSRRAPDILFPVLASAIADAGVRRVLVPMLLKRPAWDASFANYVAAAPPNPQAAAALFSVLRARGFVLPTGSEASLLGALVSTKNYPVARDYLIKSDRRRRPNYSWSPTFAENPATPSPFDWNPVNDVGLSSSIQRTDQAGIFSFSAVPGAGGPVLRQLQMLPPGRYEIVSRLEALSPADTPIFWTVQCVDGVELARLPINVTSVGSPALDGRFSVPGDCPAQWLTLAVAARDALGGSTGEVHFAQIRPSKARN